MSEYVVIFERAEDGGWGAYLPDLPGVVALGATREQVSDRIKEAVGAYFDEMAALRTAPARPRRRNRNDPGSLTRRSEKGATRRNHEAAPAVSVGAASSHGRPRR